MHKTSFGYACHISFIYHFVCQTFLVVIPERNLLLFLPLFVFLVVIP
jgi:hypothetical protein